MIFKKRDKINQNLIEELDNREDVFYRWHNPNYRLSSRSKSWGMIYSTEKEALKDGGDILNGKSCMTTLEEIFNFVDQFDQSYVLIAFEGKDTGETGHDGEYVATYYKKIKTFNFIDALELANNTFNK